jgi:hypothetical protein
MRLKWILTRMGLFLGFSMSCYGNISQFSYSTLFTIFTI